MRSLRIATYNVEWFASLFDDRNALIEDQSWSGRHDVTKAQQIAALGTVFQAVDADVWMIIEAPNSGGKQDSATALETFARHFGLRQTRALTGFENDTQQEIALLWDPAKADAWHDPQGRETGPDGGRVAPRFDGAFRLDVDIDSEPDPIVWSKPPLEVQLHPTDGPALRLIGVHAKSKAPHGAKTNQEAVRISIANRRKQLAQCIWLRQRIDDHLNAGDLLIVLGDLNDGPGLDEYEKLFGRSGIEIVMGAAKAENLRLVDPHAQQAMRPRGVAPTTARFFNHRTRKYLNALLDYVMLSPDLAGSTDPKWHIWHPFDDPACYGDGRLCKALVTASDHFPVSVDLTL